jgi:hypothetical protein
MTTICNQCKIEKPNNEYYSYYKSRCKKCVNSNRRKQRSEKYNERLEEEITCSQCKITKQVSEYYESNLSRCKECVKGSAKEHAASNPERKKENDRIWRENNKEHKKETDKAWREANKDRKKATDDAYRLANKDNEEYKEMMRLSRQTWRENNPDYKKQPHIKIMENTRKRISTFLAGDKKDEHSEVYLGCTRVFFKKWLEYQFDSKMNWDNYGSYWQIDHVIGCNNFDIDEESLKKCFHWSNTRPLEKTRNISKSDNVYLHTNVLHSLILYQFLKNNDLVLGHSFNTYSSKIIIKLGDKVKLRETPKNLTTTWCSNAVKEHG